MLTVVWTLGDVLRKLREERGWTQEQLGVRAGGMHKTAIVRLERQSDKSERTTIDRAARAFQVSVADLYAFVEEASVLSELSAVERRHVMDYARRLLDKRQRVSSPEQDASPQSDLPVAANESHEPAQKRLRR